MQIECKIFTKVFDYYEEYSDDDFIVVQGYCIYDNKVLKNRDFLELFKNIETNSGFENILIKIDGLFRIIIKKNNRLFFAVDSIRSLPLFYSYNGKKIIISDDSYYIKDKFHLIKLVEEKIKEFLYLSLTTSNKTILKDLYQVDTGVYCSFDIENKELSTKYYYYNISNHFIDTKNDFYNKALENLVITFEKLIKSLNNQMVLIPLSGGYDSRLIVVMLKKLGYKNVICFSYGDRGSFEVDISKKVAKELGFKWYFIEFNNKLIKENIFQDDFKEYIFFSGNYSSIPHFQDFLAVKYLKENNLISPNSIFIPGHSGDLLGGSHLRNFKSYIDEKNLNGFNKNFDISELIFDFWLDYYYPSSKFTSKEKNNLKEDINYFFKDLEVSEVNSYQYLTDCWDSANRQGKFIVNSCRVYEFFEYEFRLPLWDRNFSKFWLSVPVENKFESILYNDFLENIFDEYNVNYKKQKKNIDIKFYIKKIIGRKYINYLKSKVNSNSSNDINNFSIYIKYILEMIEIKYPIDINHIDMISGSWYLDLITKKTIK